MEEGTTIINGTRPRRAVSHHGAALSALLLGACTVTGDCSSNVSTSVQHDGPLVADSPPPLPESPAAVPSGDVPAQAATPKEQPATAPTLAEALQLVADVAVTKLSADALAQRIAPFGPVSREESSPARPGLKLTTGNAAQHVEAVYMPRDKQELTFYEITLDFPAEQRQAADVRFAEVAALLKKAHGKPIPFTLAPGELPSAVWKLKRPYQLFLEMLDQRDGRVRVHVGLSVSVDD